MQAFGNILPKACFLFPPSQHQHCHGKCICASEAAGRVMHKDAGALVIALRYNLHIPAKRSTGIASDTLQSSEGRHARLQGKRIAHPFSSTDAAEYSAVTLRHIMARPEAYLMYSQPPEVPETATKSPTLSLPIIRPLTAFTGAP